MVYNHLMLPQNLPAPVWVDKPDALLRMVSAIKHQPYVAVDTESNSLYVYREQVCLIQISTVDQDYLLDPLALVNLSSLVDIFSNPSIEKVFHAAEYDLICLKRDYGFTFENLFDTMIASRILGRPEVGLGSLLQDEFGVVLNKRYQRADWGRRPLSTDLLEYARLDSHYLIPLRERLWDDLVRKELDGLALEDFRRSCKVTIPKNGKTTLPCWKISGGQDLTSRQMAVLQALCEFREQFAQSANLPPFKVLTNEALIQLTLNLPESMGDMESVPGLGKRQKLRFGPDLLMAIQRGLNSEPPKRNSKPEKPSDNYLTRLEALRTWRKVTAQKMGVPSDVILPRSALEDVAAANPQTLDELLIISAEHPWRFTHFGQQILDVLGGQLEQ